MSYSVTIDVWCDHILDDDYKCCAWTHGNPYGSKRDASRNAKAAGWTRKGSEHFCPEHSPQAGSDHDG